MKTNSKKKVAAVLFTDIEGYTLVSNHNQQRGLEMARVHREVIQFYVAIYGGECINFYGDGSLSLFKHAKDAVSCAIQMQHRFRMEGGIPVRIGIHTGEVFCDPGSAYGDTVNIASRIQNIAPKGGILVSGEVYESTGRPLAFRMVSIGSEKLKNIPYPVRLYYVDHPDVTIPEKGEVHRRAVAKSEVKPKTRNPIAYVFFLVVVVISAMATIFIDTTQYMPPPAMYEAKLAVMPFYNLTGNPCDSVIGCIAADRIINRIRELPGTDVQNYTSLDANSADNKAGLSGTGNEPRATYPQNLILGKYFREDDSIVFKAELISLVTNRYLHIWEPQKSHYQNPMEALGKMENAIKGYWAERNKEPKRMPNFEANEIRTRTRNRQDMEDSLSIGCLERSMRQNSPNPDALLPGKNRQDNQYVANLFGGAKMHLRKFLPVRGIVRTRPNARDPDQGFGCDPFNKQNDQNRQFHPACPFPSISSFNVPSSQNPSTGHLMNAHKVIIPSGLKMCWIRFLLRQANDKALRPGIVHDARSQQTFRVCA